MKTVGATTHARMSSAAAHACSVYTGIHRARDATSIRLITCATAIWIRRWPKCGMTFVQAIVYVLKRPINHPLASPRSYFLQHCSTMRFDPIAPDNSQFSLRYIIIVLLFVWFFYRIKFYRKFICRQSTRWMIEWDNIAFSKVLFEEIIIRYFSKVLFSQIRHFPNPNKYKTP